MYKLLFILLIGLIGFQVALGQKEEESERCFGGSILTGTGIITKLIRNKLGLLVRLLGFGGCNYECNN
ncbi:unnamed protein product [Acanthoscelides obtectus]|uniref:Uncharacterized protein n=1 Tax=Acanthoscelides obtectus TaxID=200917 RepID=A0A9P0P460_ACAOB|nr:unnamed protein product [Acanthoscelides obtectus]CAK1632327.1 hypothetical protein AOBTE_LOCUS7485 [Acanthoscelides obtectus]